MDKMPKPDYMSDREYEDLEYMKAEVINKKLSTYDYLVSVLRYTAMDLEHSGYRNMTAAQAIEKILINNEKAIEKLHKDYIKKYPD